MFGLVCKGNMHNATAHSATVCVKQCTLLSPASLHPVVTDMSDGLYALTPILFLFLISLPIFALTSSTSSIRMTLSPSHLDLRYFIAAILYPMVWRSLSNALRRCWRNVMSCGRRVRDEVICEACVRSKKYRSRDTRIMSRFCWSAIAYSLVARGKDDLRLKPTRRGTPRVRRLGGKARPAGHPPYSLRALFSTHPSHAQQH
jgi:hypothetical protein